jgi:hypothetical protein
MLQDVTYNLQDPSRDRFDGALGTGHWARGYVLAFLLRDETSSLANRMRLWNAAETLFISSAPNENDHIKFPMSSASGHERTRDVQWVDVSLDADVQDNSREFEGSQHAAL